jgi:putative transposase
MRAGLTWLRFSGDYVYFLCLGLRSRTSLGAENLFVRKQLAFYQERKIKPRRADNPTRLTLVLLSRWFNWRDALTVVRPRTLLGWQRKGLRLFWCRRSAAGRRSIPVELQRLIRRIAGENPSWGEERIANERVCRKFRVWSHTIEAQI